MNIFPKTISDKIVYSKGYTYHDPVFGKDINVFVYIFRKEYKSWFSDKIKRKYITELSCPDIWKPEITYDGISFNKNFSEFLNNIKNKTFIKYLNTIHN